jgi:hypothetical protein
MTDSNMARKSLDVFLPKYVRDQALGGKVAQRAPICGSYTSAFLTPVLESKQAVERNHSRITTDSSRQVCANHPACFTGRIRLGIEETIAFGQDSLAHWKSELSYTILRHTVTSDRAAHLNKVNPSSKHATAQRIPGSQSHLEPATFVLRGRAVHGHSPTGKILQLRRRASLGR